MISQTVLKNGHRICAAILIAVFYAFMPSPAPAETLADALIKAYNNNPTLRASRAELRAVDENVAQARSGWRPRITLTASYGLSDSDSIFPRPTSQGILDFGDQTSSENRAYNFRAEQPVFEGGSIFAGNRQAKHEVMAQRAILRTTEQRILLEAVTAFMDVMRDTEVLKLRENNVRVLRRQLEASNDRFEVGEITRTDVAQSEARLSRAVSGRIGAVADLAASRAFYQKIVGNMPGTLDPPPELPPLPPDQGQAMSLAQSQHPNVVAAQARVEASRSAIAVNRGGILPEISIVAQHNVNSADTVSQNAGGLELFSKTTTDSVTAQATWRLYQGGATQSRIRQARQVLSQRRHQVTEAQRAVAEEAINAWEQLLAARSTIDSAESQVRANEIALEGVRQEAEVGSRTTLDVLDAEQELLDSRVELVRAQRNEYVAAFRLIAAIGHLDAEWLGLPVEIYDPTDHYNRVKNKFFGFGSVND